MEINPLQSGGRQDRSRAVVYAEFGKNATDMDFHDLLGKFRVRRQSVCLPDLWKDSSAIVFVSGLRLKVEWARRGRKMSAPRRPVTPCL